MEENIRKEVETLKLMARNWKGGFMTWIEPGTDNSYVYQQFAEDIETHALPYIARLAEMDHLTSKEAKELIDYFYEQIKKLKEEAGD